LLYWFVTGCAETLTLLNKQGRILLIYHRSAGLLP